MNFWTCLLIFVFFIQHFIEIQSKSEDKFQYIGARFKSIKCQSDNITVITKYCYLKAVSRKVVTLNFGVKLLVLYSRPYYIHSVLNYRYGTIFRQIIDTKKIEVCGILDGIDTNPLVKLVFDMIKSRMPANIFHKCPYTGDWDFNNFTLNLGLVDKATMLFPEGTYRADISLYFRDVITYNLSTTIEMKTPLKESFG
ncbi:hypothetical protein ACKWTF_015806 [Chironomus riparius]